MAYDEALAQRVLDLVAGRDDVADRRMFGGWALMLGGHMACGVIGDELLARVGREGYEDALDLPHARIMEWSTHPPRPMTGFVIVGRAAVDDDAGLRSWVERGIAFVGTLPPKA
jgi:TfoX/Sxy family transcriptional regulator of competence genes